MFLPRLHIRIVGITHDIIHTLHLGDHLLHRLAGADQFVGRLHEGTQESLERHDHTDCERTVQHQVDASAQNRQIRDLCHQVGDRAEKYTEFRITIVLSVYTGLKACPSSEHASFCSACLDRLDHTDAGRCRRREFGAVTHLDTRKIDSLGGDQGGDTHVDEDGKNADQCKDRTVFDHYDQIEHHHHGVDHKGSKSIDKRTGYLSIGRLPVRNI